MIDSGIEADATVKGNLPYWVWQNEGENNCYATILQNIIQMPDE